MGQSGDISQLSRATRLAIAVACACTCALGCKGVDDGAVELSWRLRPASGPRVNSTDPFVDCDPKEPGTGEIAEIRLDWQVGSASGSSSWRCDDNTGVTGFDLPSGTALLSIVPVCTMCEATIGTYIAPAPVQRDVIVGDTIILGALEIVVQVSECSVAHPCICGSCLASRSPPPGPSM